MKKVLHIIDNLWLGWAQTVLKWIFEYENNSNIFLYSLRKTEITTHINHQNIFINNLKNKFTFPIFKLRKYIKENNIEILHCHLYKSQIIWWLLKILFFSNIKLVFHEHWAIQLKGKVYPFFMNLFRNKVDIYVAISESIQKYILQKTSFQENKVDLLYNFVDLKKFKKIENLNIKEEKIKFWFKENDFIVWFAWRLVNRKWWRDFINSAKKIINNWFDIKFLIAWDWEDKEKILQEIKNISNIKYIWYLNNMVNFYNTIDCFIFSSHWEPLGLTWIEANACGCPVIASNIEWLNEIMIDGKNALLFEKWNIDDWVEKIEKIYKDEWLRKMLISNWREEVKKYSLDKYLIELNKMYEKL